MSDTPRTDLMVEHAPIGLRTNAAFEQSCDLCRTLERELNAANDRIKRLEEFVEQLTNPNFTRDDLPKEALLQSIKRLEEAGDAMATWLSDPRNLGDDPFMSSQWQKAKEAKP